MPLVRKRPAEPVDDYPDSSPAPTPRATQQTQQRGRGTQQSRRQRSPGSDAEEGVEGGEGGEESDNTSIDQMAKKLVRYALACEYARIPLRRQDIGTKVLGTRSRDFKKVFEKAQDLLADIFGMQMQELEKKEKVTISQKRAAQMSQNASKSSGQWIVKNMLPQKYLTANIISPPRAPTIEAESQYVGLYTMIVSLILLAGGTLPEAKLTRHLKRLNADQTTPIDKTEKVLARMAKDGYIIKVKDNQTGEETVDYVVGPRGKAEVGADGVATFVTTVYGEEADDKLQQRLARSLGISERGPAAGEAGGPATQNGSRRGRGRPRREENEDEGEEEE